MPVKLPTIYGKFWRGMSACGKIEPASEDVNRLIDSLKGKEMTAEFKRGNSRFVIRAAWKHSPDSDLHVDLVRRKAFTKKVDWVPNTTVDDIQSYFDGILGSRTDCLIRARYRMPRSELPKKGFVSSTFLTFFDTGEGDVSISLSGAKFTLKGVPASILEWELDDNKQDVIVDLAGGASVQVNEQYLTDIYEMLESTFQVFVLGKVPR